MASQLRLRLHHVKFFVETCKKKKNYTYLFILKYNGEKHRDGKSKWRQTEVKAHRLDVQTFTKPLFKQLRFLSISDLVWSKCSCQRKQKKKINVNNNLGNTFADSVLIEFAQQQASVLIDNVALHAVSLRYMQLEEVFLFS